MPQCLVPLIIPTSPADHHVLPAANIVPSDPPSILQTQSMAYPSPLAATTPSATSHAPQTAHLGPPEFTIPSAMSSTALHAPTTHFPTSMTMSPLPKHKCGHPKGSVKVKPVLYGLHQKLRWPPGTGYKQRLRELLGEDAAQAAKRPRGQPMKQVSSPVSVEFGKMVRFSSLYYFSFTNLLSAGLWSTFAR